MAGDSGRCLVWRSGSSIMGDNSRIPLESGDTPAFTVLV
jgi:hypothetical protein